MRYMDIKNYARLKIRKEIIFVSTSFECLRMDKTFLHNLSINLFV